jgi:hypothetical protein
VIVAFAPSYCEMLTDVSVCKFISDGGISRSLSNADGYIPSVNPRWVFLNLFFKKLFRINNIKVYKLIVKKPIMQIKFY